MTNETTIFHTKSYKTKASIKPIIRTLYSLFIPNNYSRFLPHLPYPTFLPHLANGGPTFLPHRLRLVAGPVGARRHNPPEGGRGVNNLKLNLKQQLGIAYLLILIVCGSNTYANTSKSCRQLQTVINVSPLSLDPHRFTAPEDHDDQFLGDITVFYKQSFHNNKITKTLFGDYLCTQNTKSHIAIQGSQVADRASHALFADYFYLPDTFESIISFNPTMQTTFVDFGVVFNLNALLKNLSLKIYGPFAHTKWRLNAKECIINNADGIIKRGRFSPQEITDEDLFHNALDFFTGHMPPPLTQNLMDPENPEGNRYLSSYTTLTRNPLLFHTFDSNKSIHASTSENGFDELRADLCYNFIHNHHGSCTFYLTGAAPTANHIQSSALLFGPTLGNGQHWEAGAGAQGNWHCWKSQNQHHKLELHGNIQATHVFDTIEQRTFDLKNKPLSRYMLAAELKPIADGGITRLTGSLTQPSTDPERLFASYQFNYNTTPVANLTTQNIKISCDVQLEAAAWLSYEYKNITGHLGYSLWMQTAEKIKTDCLCPSALSDKNSHWVLHGDANVFGYRPKDIPGEDIVQDHLAIPLPISDSNATITHGTSQQEEKEGKNYLVDNAYFAYSSQYNQPSPSSRVTQFDQANTDENQIKISIDPIFISTSDIDFIGNPLLMSHKIFGSLGYVHETEKISPFIIIGGECEFANFVWQWGAWTKIGVKF